jgi:hypothetical protein
MHSKGPIYECPRGFRVRPKGPRPGSNAALSGSLRLSLAVLGVAQGALKTEAVPFPRTIYETGSSAACNFLL